MRKAIPLILLLTLIAWGCDGTVKKAAERMTEAADALGEAQDIVISAYQSQLISKDVHDDILRATLKANEAGREITRILTALEQADVKDLKGDAKVQVLQYLQVVSYAIDPEQLATLANVHDEGTRLKIRVVLETARTAITAANLMIAGGE